MMSKKIGVVFIYSFMVIACKTIFEVIKHPGIDKVSFLVWSFVFGFLLAAMNDFDLKSSAPGWLKEKFKKNS